MKSAESFRWCEGDCACFNARLISAEGYTATKEYSPAGGMALGTDSVSIYSSLLGKKISSCGDLFKSGKKVDSSFMNSLIVEGYVGFTAREYEMAKYVLENAYWLKEAHVSGSGEEWIGLMDLPGNADPLGLRK